MMGVQLHVTKKQGLAFAPIVTNSPRVCAVTIISNDINVIVISVYMPTDDDVNFVEYGDVLHELSSIISTHNNFDIIIGGDLNVDYRRFESKNLHLLQCFIEQEQLRCELYKYQQIIILEWIVIIIKVLLITL